TRLLRSRRFFPSVGLFDDRPRPLRRPEVGPGTDGYCSPKGFPLCAPGGVFGTERDFLDVRRSELGTHPVDGQPLRPVGACEAVDLKLRAAAGDLQREQVLPLGPARVQGCPWARTAALAEQHGRVVLDRSWPE